MWESLTSKKGGELISLYMILIDEEENLIHASIWSSIVPKFKSLLHEAGLVHLRVDDDTILSDVIGCILVVGHIETVGVGWKKKRCGVYHRLDFDDTAVKMKAAAGPVILIATYSQLLQNGVHLIKNADEKKRRDENMLVERMMINDLLCATSDKDMKVPFTIVREIITSLVPSLGWFYKGCKACYKQLTTIYGGYFCGNCKAESEFPLVLYKIHIRIKDKTGETSCVLFNMVAERVFHTSAYKLLNKQPIGSGDVPAEGKTLSSKFESTSRKGEKPVAKDIEFTFVASTKYEKTSDDETHSPTKKKKRVVEDDEEDFGNETIAFMANKR
ncbi:Nucleic acid-binding, OB-fold [Cynara cardunculus var. scolymus]|uniref:Nucleic acid-binding, OB-fold n=1 Tax=Cynara cardunculus var. scolymus TaxID=59895 RepID=A0A118K0K7_CYNCS|nr:Nucleic acid-binding, OB-fold [Cynara cardunculus var. scolymus]